MSKTFAACALALGGIVTGAPALADPSVCLGAMTDIEVLFHVRQDAYFSRNPLDGRHLRIEYDGCGYLVHVGQSSPASHDGDLLWVDRYGHVTKVVRQR